MQEIMATPNVHEPLVRKGCTACHDPHGSNFPYALETVVQELCLNCHPKIRRQKNNHPTTGHPVSGLKDPSNVDRPFSCTSCHNPHSSEFDLLLAEEDIMMLCIHCHPEYK
jgi:predicted CXXCH cytochrome family protein